MSSPIRRALIQLQPNIQSLRLSRHMDDSAQHQVLRSSENLQWSFFEEIVSQPKPAGSRPCTARNYAWWIRSLPRFGVLLQDSAPIFIQLHDGHGGTVVWLALVSVLEPFEGPLASGNYFSYSIYLIYIFFLSTKHNSLLAQIGYGTSGLVFCTCQIRQSRS